MVAKKYEKMKKVLKLPVRRLERSITQLKAYKKIISCGLVNLSSLDPNNMWDFSFGHALRQFLFFLVISSFGAALQLAFVCLLVEGGIRNVVVDRCIDCFSRHFSS